MVSLVAKYQMLTAESRIKDFALNHLGLVEDQITSGETIFLEKRLIEETRVELNKKYE
jgi:hypothetical protein